MKTKAKRRPFSRVVCVLLTILTVFGAMSSLFIAGPLEAKAASSWYTIVASSSDSLCHELHYYGYDYENKKMVTSGDGLSFAFTSGYEVQYGDQLYHASCAQMGYWQPTNRVTFKGLRTITAGKDHEDLINRQERYGAHYIGNSTDPTWNGKRWIPYNFIFKCWYYGNKLYGGTPAPGAVRPAEIKWETGFIQEAISIAYRYEWDTRLIQSVTGKIVNGKWVTNTDPSTWTNNNNFIKIIQDSGASWSVTVMPGIANNILIAAIKDEDHIESGISNTNPDTNEYDPYGIYYEDSNGDVHVLRLLDTAAIVDGADANYQDMFLYAVNEKYEEFYNIYLYKKDADTNENLSGAEFTLYQKNASGNYVSYRTGTTNSSGYVGWADLPAGDYRVRETSAPSGYELNNAQIDISFPNGTNKSVSRSYTLTYSGNDANVTVYESKSKGNLKIKKVDIKGNPISGVTFGLYSRSGNPSTNTSRITTATTDSTGYATFTDLAPGTYYLHELSAPSGYKFDINKEYTGTVYSDTTTWANGGYGVENPPSSYSIEVVKKRAGGDFAYLSGVTFTLYKQDNSGSYTFGGRRYTFCKTGTTNSSGQINWTGLEEGDYCYVETSVPRGIEKDTTPHYVSFPKDGNGLGKYTKYIDNDPEIYWTPQVEKVLSKATTIVENDFGFFTFTLEEWNGSSWDLVERKSTNGSGTVTFSEIAYGRSDVGTHTYQVREVKGSDPTVSYDEHIVTFTVTVTLHRATASYDWDRLEVSTSVSSNQHPASASDKEKTTFTNYVPSGSWKANISKVLIGRWLTDDEFTFTLEKWVGPGEDDWTLLQTVKCREDHVVPFTSYYYSLADAGPNGTVKQHVYRVREVDTHDPTVIYDDHTVTYTVSVSYDRKNKTALTITESVSSSDPDMDKSEITTFTNYVPVKIEIEKDDPNGHTLAGAEFCLQWSEDGTTWANVKYTAEIEKGSCENADVVDGKLTTDDDGKIAYERLYPGLHYRLTETKAPSGMQLLAETAYEGVLPPDMTVTDPETLVSLRVVNQPVFTLPATGGHGFWNAALAVPLLCVSIAIIGLALGGGSFKKKKQK